MGEIGKLKEGGRKGEEQRKIGNSIKTILKEEIQSHSEFTGV